MESQLPRTTLAASTSDDWYERGFATIDGSRKRGIASMPLLAAQQLLRWAGYVASAEIADKRLIDPACGSGTTLLAAVQALAARGKSRRWGAERIAQEIERCIWGLDPDPVACHVTELRLHRLIGQILPDLPAARRKALQLHIHQTDSLALPADARFHYVITNPPLQATPGVVVSYHGFADKTPPRDVWLRFLDQSLRLVTWNGTLAIALPEGFLTKRSASTLREEMGREWTITHLGHLTGSFRSGTASVLLTLMRSDPSPDHYIPWERRERQTGPRGAGKDQGVRTGQLAQARCGASAWHYAIGPEEERVLARIAEPLGTIGRQPLESLVQVGRGMEIIKDAPEPSAHPAAGMLPMVRGFDVTAFTVRPVGTWLPREAFKTINPALSRLKIVLPRAAAYPQAALDASGALPHAALITLTPADGAVDPSLLLAWLTGIVNSRVIRFWTIVQGTAYQLVRPNLELDLVRRIPIPNGQPDVQVRIAGLVQELGHHLNTYPSEAERTLHYPVTERLLATLEREVQQLYGMQPEDIAVIDRWAGLPTING